MPSKIPRNAHTMIIGAMKCGTSTLFSYLSQHPEICPAVLKEPEFFSRTQGHKTHPVKTYDSLFTTFNVATHKYALEASTGYTKFPMESDVPKRIFEYGINPKFIYIVRNPYDRIVSHYNYMTRHKFWQMNITDDHLIHVSNYYIQLERYREYFSLESILIIDFDELKGAPEITLGRIYNFLGLTQNSFPIIYKPENISPNESAAERYLRRSSAFSFLKAIPAPLKNIGKTMLSMSSTPAKRVLTDPEREKIFHHLEADMLKFQSIYGFKVKKWGFSV